MFKKLRNLTCMVLASAAIASCSQKVIFTINSEPPRARVYLEESYIGETPVELSYFLQEYHYYHESLRLGKIIVAKECYLPQRKFANLDIKPEWKNSNKKKFYFNKLFILKGDPRCSYNENINRGSKADETNTNTNTLMNILRLEQMFKNR